MQPIIIPRPIVDDFFKKYTLPSIVVLLEFLKTTDGITKFVDFCAERKYTITELTSGVLFHGSQEAFSVLELPEISGGEKRCVYATDNPHYAIFLALLGIQPGGGAGVVADGENIRLSITEGFINGESKIRNGFVNVVAKNNFVATENAEYVSEIDTNVLFTIPVSYRDLLLPVHIS